MREIRKTLTKKNVVVKVYNTKTKKEEDIAVVTSEVTPEPKLPKGCVEISRETTSEKVVKYKLSPAKYFEVAEVVETEDDNEEDTE